MITEILDLSEEQPGNRAPVPRRHWRRRALMAACPLLLGGAMADTVAMAAPDQPATAADPAPPAMPSATPCPTRKVEPQGSVTHGSAPSVLLANHQPCNHHEGMVVAFRWL